MLINILLNGVFRETTFGRVTRQGIRRIPVIYTNNPIPSNNGVSNQTIANVTGTALGSIPITVTSNQTIAAITGTALGSIPITGTSNQTIATITGSATGTNNTGIIGTSNSTIATVTGSAVGIVLAIRYVRGGATFNGDGTTADAAASPGGVGAYNTPPSNTFSGSIEWRLIAGTTLNMSAVGLTTGHRVLINRHGSGANPIINSSASTLLNSSTANPGPQINGIDLIRTGGVSGEGLNISQTIGSIVQNCVITGSQVNIKPTNAVTLRIANNTLGASSTEYGISATEATTTCSNWVIADNTFNSGIGIALSVSNAANAAGKFTGLIIDGNTFNTSSSSAIIMQSAMNCTEYANFVEVTNSTTIVRHSGPTPIPLYSAGQVIFLAGFGDVSNFGHRTVVSVALDTPSAGKQTLTVSGTALVIEASGIGKGIGLVDAARCFDAPEISYNICIGQGETPMLLASISGGRIHHNDISDATATATNALAAAIEMFNCRDGLVVDFNTIDNISLGATQQVDGAGIFTDGACDTVTVRDNTISNIYGRTGVDNSGMGTAFFFARDCTHDNNTITNCYRGTWANGVAGNGNVISNNDYIDSDYGINIGCSPTMGAFTYSVGNTYTNNVIDIYSCKDCTGVSNKTVATITGTSSGTLISSGNSNQTIATVTGSATGTLLIVATSNRTIATITGSATGSTTNFFEPSVHSFISGNRTNIYFPISRTNLLVSGQRSNIFVSSERTNVFSPGSRVNIFSRAANDDYFNSPERTSVYSSPLRTNIYYTNSRTGT